MITLFHEVQFPPDISYGATFGPEFSTDVVKTYGGGEFRNQNWAMPLYKGTVSHGVRNKEQMQKLITFMLARRGKTFGFRFKDWSDFEGKGEFLGVGDGKTMQYQLKKHYGDEAYSFERIIKKPVQGTVIIYAGGKMVDATTYNVDYTNGIVYFATALGTGEVSVNLTCDFEFDVPVRFDTDSMQVNIENFNIYNWDAITIVELR